MKTIRRALLAAGILSACSFSRAATTVVLPGQDIQAIVNAAASGDVLHVLPGDYTGTIDVQGKNLTFRSSGATLPNLTKITASGCKLVLKKLQIGELVIDDAEGQPAELIALRCRFGNVTSRASKAGIYYGDAKRLFIENKAEIVGNYFNGLAHGGIGIDVNGTGTQVSIRNNRIHDYKLSTGATITEECIGIRVRGGAKADVLNNLIWGCKDTYSAGSETDCGMGVFVKEGARAVVLGNVIWDCLVYQGGTRGHHLVYAPADSVVSHNVLRATDHVNSALVGGGATAVDFINADPKFVGGSPYDYHLQATSPAINKGPPDPRYNDLDGTRNDAGLYGGHTFVPDGRTTNKPVVLGLEITPLAVPVGGVITIQSTGAVPK